MTRTILVAFGVACLMTLVPGGTATGQRKDETAPLKWVKYTGADSKEYDSPKWLDDAGERRLDYASAVILYKETPPVTKVVFRVYRKDVQGGWNGMPSIEQVLNPGPTYSAVLGGWLVVGNDPNTPWIRFEEGEQIKIVWEVTTTTNNVPSVTTVEQIITVQYH